MKRFDPVSNKEIECLFTEAAYEAYKSDPNYQDKVTVRLKTDYHTLDDNWSKVFLMRLADERNASTLRYHSEEWFDYSAMCENKRSRVSSGIRRK